MDLLVAAAADAATVEALHSAYCANQAGQPCQVGIGCTVDGATSSRAAIRAE